MKKISWKVTENSSLTAVQKDIYGGFVEHLGRNVYGGVWDPSSPAADEDGYRKDVCALIRELDMPLTRYPGGCFTDLYRWEDGVGPERKARLDPAWHQLEPNTFGLHEFMRWTRKVGTRPLITINISDRTLADTLALYEYCNVPQGTYQSDLRRKNGAVEPFGIRDWCLGNELYGSWEIGQMSAEQYGRTAREHAKLLKQLDPQCRLIVCGCTDDDDPQWNRTVLELAGEYIDMISLHPVFDRGKEGTDLTYVRTVDAFERNLIHLEELLREYETEHGKRIAVSIDEWIIWNFDRKIRPGEEWTCPMHLLEQNYGILEALITGSVLSCYHRHAAHVDVACIAQSVNVIAPIRTEEDGSSWKQSIFYPFALTSKYGRGFSLIPEENGNEERELYGSAVLSEDHTVLTLFLTNRGAEAIAFEGKIAMDQEFSAAQSLCMYCEDHLKVNSKESEFISPQNLETKGSGNKVQCILKPFSWNMITLKKGSGN